MSRRRLSTISAALFVLHLAWPIAVSADPVIVNDITRNRGRPLLEWDILTRPGQKRVAISVAVDRLHEAIASLEAERVKIDHIYDY